MSANHNSFKLKYGKVKFTILDAFNKLVFEKGMRHVTYHDLLSYFKQIEFDITYSRLNNHCNKIVIEGLLRRVSDGVFTITNKGMAELERLMDDEQYENFLHSLILRILLENNNETTMDDLVLNLAGRVYDFGKLILSLPLVLDKMKRDGTVALNGDTGMLTLVSKT